MSKPLKKITNDLDGLLEDVVHALRKSSAEMTDEAQEKLADAATKLAQAAQGVVAEARKRSAPVVKNAVDEAKAHPIATAATLAMAAAAVAGLLLSHRKNAKA